MWWIGPPGEIDDAGPGTDFNAVSRGFVSVTPIHTDLTRFQALEKVSSWMLPLSSAMGNEEAA
jgi:5'-nucleotidase